METTFPYEVPQREIYRYLGYKQEVPQENVLQKIESCKANLFRDVTPKAIWQYYDITWQDANTFLLDGIPVCSKNLSRNIADCHRICLLAVTLGPMPDRYIQKAEVTAMSDAVIYQAISAAMIESYCNYINDLIRKEAAEEDYFLRPRFSPGYGDFPLEFQRQIGDLLQMSKKIGITLKDSLLMMPSKSVTALIGLSTTDSNCHREGCEICNKSATCAFRRI
ncbi:MAG: Vitamin B12 dependent methionine synthase activation subunit [Lachnospiraceae bacterium]|nr:Vitamin B12 dependent methionine synthase activation subunit [Lachnospiraceae bacterium]